MLTLLPPSEGKTIPTSGPALNLSTLSLPKLDTPRRTVLDALGGLCRNDPVGALAVLGLSPRQADAVSGNTELSTAPTAPAWQVYTGVLFTALDLVGCGPTTRARLSREVLVWSGLWGAVGLADAIPAYRLSGAVTLPGPGRLTSFWRAPLRAALADRVAGQLVLDLRSSTYAGSWTAPPERAVAVRVIHQQGDRRTVASHFNKATKGRLLRALATAQVDPTTPDELVDAIRAAGFHAEPVARSGAASGAARGRLVLDVVVDHL
ncbi:MAG: peroxide stress protein YaaA [Candidatus Nanopelagicales bacterium]